MVSQHKSTENQASWLSLFFCLFIIKRQKEKKETEKEMLAQRQMLWGMVVTTLVVPD